MNGWMNGLYMDGWMDRRTDGQVSGLMGLQMDGWMDGSMDGCR